MLKTWREGVWAIVFASVSFAGCGSDRTFNHPNEAGAAGSSANGGNSGKAGSSGRAGSSAGHAGTGGSGGGGGTGGTGGDVSSGVGGGNRGGTGGTGAGATGGTGAIDATGGAGEAGSGAQSGDAGGGGAAGAAPGPVCGNGKIDGDDACDDGNTKSGDGCSATCQIEAGWNCDAQGCTEICGDGLVVGREALAGGCDDKNTVANDGCTSCVVDTSYFCSGAPSVCAKTCGNGVVEGGEACDDGNAMANDGCFACAVEKGYACDTSMPTKCADIDECKAGTDDCDANGTCQNTIGSFKCNCNAGYKPGTGDSCVDKNECGSDGGNNCTANSVCTNTPGSWSCACKPGYKGDPTSSTGCVDKDECGSDGGNNCTANSVCTNTPGSWSCACKPGYKGDPTSSGGCTDKDECGADGGNNCDAHATCTNTPGSFTCTCNAPQYMGSGTSCTACACANGFACSSTACKTSCSSDNDCVSDHFCSGSTCKVDAVQVSISNSHACMVLADGTARCWGKNADRELGTSSSSDASTPAQVQSITTAKLIRAGNTHTVVLLNNGSVSWWGKRIEDYDFTNSQAIYTNPVQVTPKAISTAAAVDVSVPPNSDGMTCIQVNDNTVRCWGLSVNDSGNIVFLTDPFDIGVTGATSISGGASFNCMGFSTGAKCFGRGVENELGAAQNFAQYPGVATQISGNVTKIRSGEYFSCVLLSSSSSSIQCWGANSQSELGSSAGGPFGTITPQTISGLTNLKDFSLGLANGCAVDTSGGVKCWGDDSYGQLGDNNPNNTGSGAPTAVQGLAGPASSVATGYYNACAVLQNGSVQCWGTPIGGDLSSKIYVPSTVW